MSTRLPLTLSDTPVKSAGLEIRVTGLRAGHSGLDIHENRANAVKVMARLVLASGEHVALLADFQSGDKHNAIPREGIATIVLPSEHLPAARGMISNLFSAFLAEFPHEPTMQMSCEEVTAPGPM